jgi:hypothetical protein
LPLVATALLHPVCAESQLLLPEIADRAETPPQYVWLIPNDLNS